MRILITGGSGFIAWYFHRDLAQFGHERVSFDLIDPPADQPEGAPFIRGDVRDPAAVRRALANGIDTVVHLAAAHHDFGIEHDTYYDVNERGAEVLCDAMDEAGVKRCVFYSTVATYGDAPPPHEETSPTAPNSPYGGSKLKGEGVFERWTERGDDRRALIIRPTVTFGAHNFANMYSLIRQIHSGKYLRFGAGTNIKSLSYVENIVDATLFLSGLKPGEQPTRELAPFEVVNYIDKPDYTSTQISDRVSAALGKKPAPAVPYGVGMLAGLPFDAVIKLTGKNLPISTARIAKLFKHETKFEADKLRDLGYTPKVPLGEGIDKMVEWYLRTGKNEDATWHQPPAETVIVNPEGDPSPAGQPQPA
ncbi:MAG: NAD(P)-dependent oxidoreductase [Planctomycetota bacterium]